MQKAKIQLPEVKLIGITARTNNVAERDPATAIIGQTIARYHQLDLLHEIPTRKHPGKTYCVYTDYESDITGDYTYFVGEEVESFMFVPEGYYPITLPAQTYIKFTSDRGPMPEVCIKLWQSIWQMTPEELGGKRSYHTDFEIYDWRSLDNQKTILDLYIGIEE
jgi:predicted transcriptional regulator YdeE